MEQRLQKLLAAAGVASRRSAEGLIAAGKVTVNGRTVTTPGARADPERDLIRVDGKRLPAASARLYLVLNKPTGYVSTVRDPHAEHTVLDLVRGIPVRVHPVGRLDADSAGLLLLTNDGAFTERLTHPSHQVPKTYRVVARGQVSQFAAADLRRGVILEDGMTAPAQVAFVEYDAKNNVTVLDVTIHEGRSRQVRRMMKATGHPVLALTRMRIGPIELKGLAPGTWRKLHPAEVEALLAEADSQPPELPQIPLDADEPAEQEGTRPAKPGHVGVANTRRPLGPAPQRGKTRSPRPPDARRQAPGASPEILEAARDLTAKLGRDRGPERDEPRESGQPKRNTRPTKQRPPEPGGRAHAR